MPGNPNAPTKTCPVCNRPFSWRRKWERNWDSVVYCSRRCRSRRGKAPDKDNAHENRPALVPGRPEGRRQ